jgi:apolipoprotein N-acyltransferase
MFSMVFTSGGWHFYCSLVMFTFAVGWVELIQGTYIALTAFFGIHLVTILLMLAGIALFTRLINSHRGNLLWYARDVGPSAGYYGCLGLAISHLQPSVTLPIVVTISSILGLRLLWSSYLAAEEGRTMSADIAHMLAFPLGVIFSNMSGA